MTRIDEIYKVYDIIPILQLHQLRVAAVASLICDKAEVNQQASDNIIKACLLHDMGNLLKFDMTQLPEAFQPEGVKYWQKVRDDMSDKYQTQDEHLASLKIITEIGVDKEVYSLVDNISFKTLPLVAKNGSVEQKICCYSDMRVGPSGVLSVKERLADGDKRYRGRINHQLLNNGECVTAISQIEDELFTGLGILPDDINDNTVKQLIRSLKTHSI